MKRRIIYDLMLMVLFSVFWIENFGASSRAIHRNSEVPQTSNIIAYLDTRSVDKIMKKALPLFLYFGVQNQTMAINKSFEWGKGLFKFSVDDIHFNKIKSTKGRAFGFVQDLEEEAQYGISPYDLDGDPLRLKIDDLQFDAEIKSSLTIFGWQLDFTHIEVQDIAFELLFRDEKLPHSRWQIEEISDVQFNSSKINITWSDRSIKKLLLPIPHALIYATGHWLHNHFYLWYDSHLVRPYNHFVSGFIHNLQAAMIAKVLDISRDYVIPASIGAATASLNKKINAFSDQQRFMMALPGGDDVAAAINITQVKQPIIDAEKHNIEMDFDGLVHPTNGLTFADLSGGPAEKPGRIPDAQSEQIWIHQNVINSYLRQPGTIFSQGITIDVKNLKTNIISESESVNASLIKITPNMRDILDNGKDIIQIKDGKINLADDLLFDLEITCMKNDTAKTCFKGTTKIIGALNFEFKDLKIYASFDQFKFDIDKNNLDQLPLLEPQDITQLNEIVGLQADSYFQSFNDKYSKGLHVGQLYNRLTMVGGILAETILTPKMKDGWLYGGFTLRIEVIERNARIRKEQQAKKKKGHKQQVIA